MDPDDLAALPAVQHRLLGHHAGDRPGASAAAAGAVAMDAALHAALCKDPGLAAASDLRHPSAGGGAGDPSRRWPGADRRQAPVGLRDLHLVRAAAGCRLCPEAGAAVGAGLGLVLLEDPT